MSNATTDRMARLKRYWLADNTGIQTRIAKELGVTQSFVSDILWGRRSSRSGEVEARLGELGAPGFKETSDVR